MTLQRSPEYRGQFPMRLAVTSADGQGGYPAAEEDPDKRMVYPITFVDATYPKTPGLAAVTITKRSAAATEFVCNLARGYIGVDTLIWCFFYRKRWWTRLCCKCLIFQDGFNRNTSTYVGVAWTEDDGYELEGDWWVVGDPIQGYLYLDPTSDEWPLIRCRVPMVNNRGTVYVETVDEHADEGDVPGDKYRILVNLKESAPGIYDYYFAQFDVQASQVALYKVTASGAPELLVSPTNPVTYVVTGTARTFWAHIDEHIFCAGIDLATPPLCEFAHVLNPTLFTGKTYSGLGGTTGQAQLIFDNYKLYRDQEDSPLDDCPGCGCKCQGRSVPHVLHVVLTGTGGMSAADGLEFDLHYGGPGSAQGACYFMSLYHGEITFCGVPWLFVMGCPSGNPADTTMTFFAPDGSGHNCDNVLTWQMTPPHALVATPDIALCLPAFLFEFHWHWCWGPLSYPCDACGSDPDWGANCMGDGPKGTLTATVTE